MIALLTAFLFTTPNFVAPVRTIGGDTFGSTALLKPDLAITAQHVAGRYLDIMFIRCGDTVIPGMVVKSSFEYDLALVHLIRPCTAVDTLPLMIEDVPEGAPVLIQGYPAGGPRKTTHAAVAGYEWILYEDGLKRYVQMLDGQVTGGNSGGPVIFNGKLAGIISAGLCYSVSACYGAAIPASEILKFIGQ